MPSLQFPRQLWDVQIRLSSLLPEFVCGQDPLLIPFDKHLREPGLHKGLNHLLNLTAGSGRHRERATVHANKTPVLISFRQGHSTICDSFLPLPSLLKVL